MDKKLRFLFLEDDDYQLRLGEMMLKRLGAEVVSCRNAEEARNLFLAEKEKCADCFDLLIFDLSLGGYEDGLDVYKSIRDHDPKQKCIIVSGCLHSAPARIEVEREGCQALPKPFTQEGLKEAIERALA